jgi:hypothetical protein
MSEALARVGDEVPAERTAVRAEALARAHSFHELVFRLENPPVVREPVKLAPAASAIVAAVDELEGAELVGAPA